MGHISKFQLDIIFYVSLKPTLAAFNLMRFICLSVCRDKQNYNTKSLSLSSCVMYCVCYKVYSWKIAQSGDGDGDGDFGTDKHSHTIQSNVANKRLFFKFQANSFPFWLWNVKRFCVSKYNDFAEREEKNNNSVYRIKGLSKESIAIKRTIHFI